MAAQGWVDYEWLVICGSLVAFLMGWSIGANDVANSFASSVGSKSLTMFQALCLAACCEFLGAMLLGGQVVKTIAGGITDVSAFVEEPEFLAYGMMCALVGAAVWVIVATSCDLAVSTTHSIVGGIMGFSLVYKGSNAILWYQKAIVVHNQAEYAAARTRSNYVVGSTQVPIKGLVPVIISWFSSPICCCGVAALHFFLVRTLVMRRKYALQYSYWALPVVVLYAVFLNTFFVIFKGATTGVCTKGSNGSAQSSKYSTTLCYKDVSNSPAVNPSAAAWIAAVFAGVVTLLVCIFVVPYVRRQAQTVGPKPMGWQMDPSKPRYNDGRFSDGHMGGLTYAGAHMDHSRRVVPPPEPVKTWSEQAYDAVTYGLRYDIHAAVYYDATVVELRENLERFDPRAEQSFRPVQIFTSMCVSFAHGANDVANSVGPLAAIYQVYSTHTAQGTADLPTWILAIGACGIVAGLATYGYNIMKVLGTQMAVLTPSRGFSAELATAFVVSVGSMYGFPLSTTHSQTGSVIGIGLMEAGFKGVNWKLFLRQIVGWVLTINVAGLISAALFSQGAFAPSIIMHRDIARYQDMTINLSTALIADSMGKTYDRLKKDVPVGPPVVVNATQTNAFEVNYLNYSRAAVSTHNKYLFQNITTSKGKKVLKRAPYLASQWMTQFLRDAVAAYMNSSVLTFGGNFSNGTGWNKTAFRSQRGTDFADVV